MPRNTIALVAAVLLVPSLASADGLTAESSPRREVDRSHVDAVGGIFDPLGLVAVQYTYVSSPGFEVAVGAGVDPLLAFTASNTADTVQVGVMPRARYSLGRVTITAGAGLSEGRYSPCGWFASGCAAPHALRANAEVGVEAAVLGFVGRLYLGGSYVAPLESSGAFNMDSAMRAYPYLGLGLGHRI